MATSPVPPALVVIDVQRAFDDPRWGSRNNRRAEAQIARLIGRWRRVGAPIFHVRHRSATGGMFRPGTPAFDFKPEAEPEPGEFVIEKTVNSAFIGTELERRLRAAGVTDVVIAGLTTDHCCSTTARMAANLGFRTWFVSDATATFERMGPAGERFPADLVHRTALASLAGEFAQIVSADEAVALLATRDEVAV